MAYPAEKRAEVRAVYVYERLPMRDVAKKCGVPIATAQRWKAQDCKEGDDWVRARAASRLVNGGLGDMTAEVLEDFILMFQSTMDAVKAEPDMPALQKAEIMSRLADAYTKTMKAAGGTEPKIARLSVAMEVLELLAGFIRDQYPDELERFVAILEPFGSKVSQEFA